MRLAIPVAHRTFKFGDPYYPCPQGCDDGTYYDEPGGTCYGCGQKFLITIPGQAQPSNKKIFIAGLLVLVTVLYITRERDR